MACLRPLVLIFPFLVILPSSAAQDPTNYRPPKDERDLRRWLENMVWHHRFSLEEIQQATGLSGTAIAQARARFQISPETRPRRNADAPLLVLPYPGGRHPRIGFLDGAVRPQRETKISVFTPWDPDSYVVLDIPEAIWSNLGLTYLAHTHIPTIFDKQQISLPSLEWSVLADGVLTCQRALPNGIQFGTKVIPGRDGVRMEMWLTNGTAETLTDLRVQNCALLKAADGFNARTNDNKLFAPPFAACRSSDGNRWIIQAWRPIQRTWGNPPCPCLHADPQFPDCAPGETQRVQGWFSFYEGSNIQEELRRLENLDWSGGGD